MLSLTGLCTNLSGVVVSVVLAPVKRLLSMATTHWALGPVSDTRANELRSVRRPYT